MCAIDEEALRALQMLEDAGRMGARDPYAEPGASLEDLLISSSAYMAEARDALRQGVDSLVQDMRRHTLRHSRPFGEHRGDPVQPGHRERPTPDDPIENCGGRRYSPAATPSRRGPVHVPRPASSLRQAIW